MKEIIDQLLHARSLNERVDTGVGSISSINRAYEIQDSIAQNLGEITGWKLGRIENQIVFAPVHDSHTFVENKKISRSDLCLFGFEAELGIIISEQLLEKEVHQLDVADILNLIVHVVELVGARDSAEIGSLPTTAAVADHFILHSG